MEQWAQLITTLLSTLTIIWWFREESRDYIKESRKESCEDWKRCQITIEAIRTEIKDFHERLIKIETERNK